MIKRFHEFIENQTVRTIKPDKERAKSLVSEAERKLRVLNRQIKTLGLMIILLMNMFSSVMIA